MQLIIFGNELLRIKIKIVRILKLKVIKNKLIHAFYRLYVLELFGLDTKNKIQIELK